MKKTKKVFNKLGPITKGLNQGNITYIINKQGQFLHEKSEIEEEILQEANSIFSSCSNKLPSQTEFIKEYGQFGEKQGLSNNIMG